MDFLTDEVDWCETGFRLSFELNGVTIVGQPDLLVGYHNHTLDSSYTGGTAQRQREKGRSCVHIRLSAASDPHRQAA